MERLLEELAKRADLDTSRKIADELVAREVVTPWQAGKLLEGKNKGFVLGPYRVLRPLGQGGMGTVFLAQHQMMRRQCAIKVLPSKGAKDDSSMLDRFYREAQAVAALDHPNIVRAYDVNKELQKKTEIHYLVMEYVEGHDLQVKVEKEGVLGYREAADHVRQAAEGLAHAHEAGLVHRDVKPANLLVDASGTVKILDLGLARFFDDSEGASLTNQFGDTVLGTVDYLAPEQAIDCHDVDARADVYGLGQTFYFLLTGHPPFPEGSVAQRLMAHQTRAPEPIQHERPDVPPSLVAIIDRMTAKKPEERYQTAKEVAEVLGTWLRDYSGDSGVLSRAASLRRGPLPKRHREPTRASSSPAEDTDLELAPLEDDEPSSSLSGSQPTVRQSPSDVLQSPSDLKKSPSDLKKSPSDVKKSPSDVKKSPSDVKKSPSGIKRVLPDVEKDDVVRTPPDSKALRAPSSDVVPRSPSDSQTKAPKEVAPPKTPDDMDDIASPKENWMSSLLEEDSLPEAVAEAAPRPLPSSLGKSQATKVVKKEEGTSFGKILSMPAVWIGAAGLLLLVVILVVVLATSGSDDDATGPEAPSSPMASDQADKSPRAGKSRPRKRQAKAQPGEQEAAPSPDELGVSEATPRENPLRSSDSVESTLPPDDESPARPHEAEPRRPDGDVAPSPAQSVDQPSKRPPRKTRLKPKAKPPAEKAKVAPEPPKPDPVDLKERFAAVRGFSIQLTSVEPNPKSKLNMLVKQQLTQAAERAGLSVTNDDAVVMHLNVEASQVEDLIAFVMSAKLECRDSESQVLQVWEHKDRLATISPRLLRRPTIPLPLKTAVGNFFDKFARDYRNAQAGRE
jgi:serine/threonine protein kinase